VRGVLCEKKTVGGEEKAWKKMDQCKKARGEPKKLRPNRPREKKKRGPGRAQTQHPNSQGTGFCKMHKTRGKEGKKPTRKTGKQNWFLSLGGTGFRFSRRRKPRGQKKKPKKKDQQKNQQGKIKKKKPPQNSPTDQKKSIKKTITAQ